MGVRHASTSSFVVPNARRGPKNHFLQIQLTFLEVTVPSKAHLRDARL